MAPQQWKSEVPVSNIQGGGADHSPVSVTSDPRLGLGSSAPDTDTATDKGSQATAPALYPTSRSAPSAAMVWTTAAKCSLLALLLAACCPTNAQFAEDGGDLAVPFCNSAGKTLSCGWASESEQKSSIKKCIFCGSVWGGEITSVPTTLDLGSSAFKLFPRVISLGCSGPVVVRTEFKVLSSTDGCSRLLKDYLGSQASGTSSITR
ncbi:uncharacterized protein HaLaN_24193, partial [Haematococcus lacustris]